jgi:nondiscriminating glutamyl-tRNA synthetase
LITLADIGAQVEIFFDDKYKLTDAAGEILKKENARTVVNAFADYLKTNDNADARNLYVAAMKYVKEKTGAKGKELFMPIRAALTGAVHGPELDRVFAILGKETAVKRLRRYNN